MAVTLRDSYGSLAEGLHGMYKVDFHRDGKRLLRRVGRCLEYAGLPKLSLGSNLGGPAVFGEVVTRHRVDEQRTLEIQLTAGFPHGEREPREDHAAFVVRVWKNGGPGLNYWLPAGLCSDELVLRVCALVRQPLPRAMQLTLL